jgi:tRNA U38,U39,U40 pseudouridine synthase TruA
MLAVGRGGWSAAQFGAALAAADRSKSAPPAAPQGLVLVKVTYPEDLAAFVDENE